MGTVKFPMFIASTVFGDFSSGYHVGGFWSSFNRWIRWNGCPKLHGEENRTPAGTSPNAHHKDMKRCPKLDGIGSQVGENSSCLLSDNLATGHHKTGSLPETNSSPLNSGPLEKEILSGNHHF